MCFAEIKGFAWVGYEVTYSLSMMLQRKHGILCLKVRMDETLLHGLKRLFSFAKVMVRFALHMLCFEMRLLACLLG